MPGNTIRNTHVFVFLFPFVFVFSIAFQVSGGSRCRSVCERWRPLTLWHWIDRADSLKEYNDNDDDVDVYVDVDVHVGVGVDGENGDD